MLRAGTAAGITFALNATLETLPTRDNLVRWGRTELSKQCPLCHRFVATIRHVLNGCPLGLSQGRYLWRHDSVLAHVVGVIEDRLLERRRQASAPTFVSGGTLQRQLPGVSVALPGGALPAAAPAGPASKSRKKRRTPGRRSEVSGALDDAADWQLRHDLGGTLVIPPELHGPTLQRPDLLLFSRSARRVILGELTCPVEDRVAKSEELKTARYRNLVIGMEACGWRTELFTFEVGSRGYSAPSMSRFLRHLGIKLPLARFSVIGEIAAQASYMIYLSRECPVWLTRPLLHDRYGDIQGQVFRLRGLIELATAAMAVCLAAIVCGSLPPSLPSPVRTGRRRALSGGRSQERPPKVSRCGGSLPPLPFPPLPISPSRAAAGLGAVVCRGNVALVSPSGSRLAGAHGVQLPGELHCGGSPPPLLLPPVPFSCAGPRAVVCRDNVALISPRGTGSASVSPSPFSPVALLAREGTARLAVADGWAAGFEAVEAAARAGWLPAMSPGLARATFVDVTFPRARAIEISIEAAFRRLLCRICLKDEEVVSRAGLAGAAVALHAELVSAAVRGAVDVAGAGAAVVRLAAVRALPPLSLSPSSQAVVAAVPLSPRLPVARPEAGALPSGGTVAAESPPPRPPAADARAVVLLSGATGDAAAVRGVVDVARTGAAVVRPAAVRQLPPLSLSPSSQAVSVAVPLSPRVLVALPADGVSPSGGTVAAASPPPRPPAADARAVVLLSGAMGEAVVPLAGVRRARSSGPSQEHQRLVRRGDVLLPAPSQSLQPRRSVTP